MLLTQFFADTQGSVVLTPTEERRLLYRIQILKDPVAMQELAMRNIRLVLRQVSYFFKKRYKPGERKADTLYLDCVQSGILGVYVGAARFDTSKHTKFSTYGVWWIDYHIRHQLTFDRQAVQPVRVLKEMGRVTTNIVGASEVEGLDMMFPVDGEDVDGAEETSYMTAKLRGALESCEDITDMQRFILARRYGLDHKPIMTYRALEELLHIPQDKVKALEHKALQVLYVQMKDWDLQAIDEKIYAEDAAYATKTYTS
jgi:RNA polymerase sigma factor (sigma-70 family)